MHPTAVIIISKRWAYSLPLDWEEERATWCHGKLLIGWGGWSSTPDERKLWADVKKRCSRDVCYATGWHARLNEMQGSAPRNQKMQVHLKVYHIHFFCHHSYSRISHAHIMNTTWAASYSRRCVYDVWLLSLCMILLLSNGAMMDAVINVDNAITPCWCYLVYYYLFQVYVWHYPVGEKKSVTISMLYAVGNIKHQYPNIRCALQFSHSSCKQVFFTNPKMQL